jgi:hypothetical protein
VSYGPRLMLDTWSAEQMASRYRCDTVSTPWLLVTEGVVHGSSQLPREFRLRASVDMAAAAGVHRDGGTH